MRPTTAASREKEGASCPGTTEAFNQFGIGEPVKRCNMHHQAFSLRLRDCLRQPLEGLQALLAGGQKGADRNGIRSRVLYL
jgi:hypothetical protein